MTTTDRPFDAQERHISPALAQKVQERWGIDYYAVEDMQAALLVSNPDIHQPDSTPTIEPVVQETPVVDAAPVASTAIDLAARREQQKKDEQEVQLAQIREQIKRLTA